jgi:hypothetical protein
VKAQFAALQKQATSFFSYFDTYSQYHGAANVIALEVAALTELTLAFVTSLNIPGGIAAVAFYATLAQITGETFSNASPDSISDKKAELLSLYNNAQSQFLSYLEIYDNSIKRISFDGGAGEFEQGYTTTTNTGQQVTVTSTRTNQVSAGKAEMEGGLFGFGWKSSSDAQISSGAISGQTGLYGNTQANTVIMHFSDPNPADSFVIDLYEDNYYGVPLFKLEPSSSTSCPQEPGTNPVEVPFMEILGSNILANIPEDSKYGAVFTIEISNISQNYSNFVLMPDPTTTQDLQLYVAGSPFLPTGIVYYLGGSTPRTVVITAFKGPNGRSYQGVSIILASACENDLSGDPTSGVLPTAIIQTTVTLGVTFIPACFDVEWDQSYLPFPPVLVQGGQTTQLTLVAYFPTYSTGLENDVNKVSFFYRRVGDIIFESISSISGAPDPSTSTVLYKWTPSSNLADGEYELQIQANCNYSVNPSFSPSVILQLDQTPFEVFGVISPLGGAPLLKGQEISVLFNKDLDCPKLLVTMQQVTNLTNQLNFQTVCDGKGVDLLISSSSQDSLKGSDFQVNITAYSLTGYELFFSFVLQPSYDYCQSSPCQNGGLCVDTLVYFQCECVNGFTGPLCQNGIFLFNLLFISICLICCFFVSLFHYLLVDF